MLKSGSVNGGESVKEEENVRNHVRKNFPFKLPLKQESLLAKKRDGEMFGYVQCDLEVPTGLKYKFSNFPPIFKNFNVSRADIGDYMRDYAVENNLLKQPQRMLISSFNLENGTIITPLLNFYISLGLKCTRIYRFVQYTPRKCFNTFVQSVVDARRSGDENPDSSVVAETMKLLGNSSYGCQIMDRSKHTEDERTEEDDEADMSTQFLQMQKNQLLDLQQHFERYVNTLPVFGFNSGKYDLNLIKSYLLPYLIHERDIQPTVIKKANHFVSLKFGDKQFLDILNFLGGATSLDSFLKAYKTNETKGFFPYEWFDSPEKLDATFLPPYDRFFSKLRNYNPLEKEFTDFTKLLNSGFSQQESLKKLRLKNVPPSGIDNYNYLKVVWEQEKMVTFRDFVKWYSNKDVVPTLEAMQKMMEFYHNKGIDMLKLGCTLPNLANICLHKSTNHKFFPFVEADKDLHDKIREDMTGGPSIVFTRKAVVDQTFIRNSENLCKSVVGIDASQLYPFSMCQEMPTGLYTRWEFDTDSQKFRARTNRSRTFENMVMSYLQSQRSECKIESYYTTGKQKKIDCFSVDGFCTHCNTGFEAMSCYFHFCPCQEAKASLSEEETQRGIRKREHDELRRDYLKSKGYKIVEIWECKWRGKC